MVRPVNIDEGLGPFVEEIGTGRKILEDGLGPVGEQEIGLIEHLEPLPLQGTSRLSQKLRKMILGENPLRRLAYRGR